MNESQIIAWLHTYVYAAPEVQLEMIREMAQRFGGLRRDLATRNEEIGQLRDEYQKLMVHWAGAVQLQDEYKARIAELDRQAEKREAELIRQVDCVIDLQAQLRAVQAVIDAAKTAVDFQPEEGSETDYATARRLWAELVIAVRKVQPAE